MIAVTSFLILMFSRTRVHHDIMPSSYHNVLYYLAATVASRIVHIWVKLEGMDKVLKITLLGRHGSICANFFQTEKNPCIMLVTMVTILSFCS